jgi:hypothetical protein
VASSRSLAFFRVFSVLERRVLKSLNSFRFVEIYLLLSTLNPSKARTNAAIASYVTFGTLFHSSAFILKTVSLFYGISRWEVALPELLAGKFSSSSLTML